MIGGLGLFLEPAGLPRGLLAISPSIDETGWTALGNAFRLLLVLLLLPLSAASWFLNGSDFDPTEVGVRVEPPAIVMKMLKFQLRFCEEFMGLSKEMFWV